MQAVKFSNLSYRWKTMWMTGLVLLTLLNATMVRAQQEPRTQSPSERAKPLPVEEIRRKPGVLLYKGENDEPVGPIKARTYRIEEVKLDDPIEIGRKGAPMRIERIARLTITGEFPPGTYSIKIGDDWLLDNVDYGLNELSLMIYNLPVFEEGASITVARGYGCHTYQHTVLPEKLVVPEGLPDHLRSIPYRDGEDGNRIRIIRSLPDSIVVRGAADVEIILDTKMRFPILNTGLVLQIGDQEFGRDPFRAPGALVFRLTAEEFARAPDGGRVKVKLGECSAGGVRFGRLDKSMLDRK